MAARSLFRTMLREAAQVDQYNFRNYAIRRVREDFRRNAALSGSGRDGAPRGQRRARGPAAAAHRRAPVLAAQSVMDAEASRAFEDAADAVIDPVGGAGDDQPKQNRNIR